GLLSIAMSVETPSTADAVRETFHELDALTAGEVGTDELDRAKQYLSGLVRTQFDTNSSTVSTLATLYAYDLPPDYYQTRPARLAGITPADVAAVARRRFPPGGFTVVAVGDRATIEAPLRALNLGTVALRTP
ncbi:MAG: insulinase family protein, partial [Actinobacteria bacterium]|nr:insulinase family protein [Actinomycetota bacterium]